MQHSEATFAFVSGPQQLRDLQMRRRMREREFQTSVVRACGYTHLSVTQLLAQALGCNMGTARYIFIHRESCRRKLPVTPFLRVPLTEHTIQTPKECILRHHPKYRLGPFVRLPFPFFATEADPEVLQRAEQRENSETRRCLVLGNCRSGRRGLEECIGHIEVVVMVARLEPPTVLVVLIPATDHAEEDLHYAIHIVLFVLVLAHSLTQELLTILLLGCE